MNKFNSYSELLDYLEKNSYEHKYFTQMSRIFEHYIESGIKDSIEEAEAEKLCWNINLKNGDVVEWQQSMGLLSKLNYKYFLKRLETTGNPKLQAQYSHLIWLGHDRHSRYAEKAIGAYLALIGIYEKMDRDDPDDFYGLSAFDSVINAFYIAKRSKIMIELVKDEILSMIKERFFDCKSILPIKIKLTEIALTHRIIFIADDFIGIDLMLDSTGSVLEEKNNLHGAIELYKVALRLDGLSTENKKILHSKIASCWERLMIERSEGDGARPYFCQNAAESYKLAGDLPKAQEMQIRLIKEKRNMKFSKFEQEINITDEINRYKAIASTISQKPTIDIFKIVILDKSILPQRREIEKALAAQDRSISDFIPAQLVDGRGNAAKVVNTDEEKREYALYQHYKIIMQIYFVNLINIMFSELASKKKFTVESFICYLSENSWFCGELQRPTINGEAESYKWIDLIRPSIEYYFAEVDKQINDSAYVPSMILPIDSLTLKFEGMLRDLYCLKGGNPTVQKRKGSAAPVEQEIDINGLLHSNELKELIDEDDLLFLKFLLIEKAGFNLRHEIAHGLWPYKNYSLSLMNLILVALLRLSKYSIVEKQADTLS